MTTSSHKTRQNKIISLVGGAGTDPAKRYISDDLITDGWVAYVNSFLAREVFFRADETWIYLPWGTGDINAYDFCGLQACTGPLARVANPIEFQSGMTNLHRATRKPIGFYLGNPVNDPTLNPLWTSGRTAWYMRVEAAVFPIGLVKGKGIPVRMCVDAAGAGADNAQCAALLDYLAGYGPVLYEPRPVVPGAAMNLAKYGTLTNDFAFRDDYAGFGAPPVPAAQLKGPKTLLCLAQRMPGDYAEYVRKIGEATGADIAVTNNELWRGTLTAAAFRATIPVPSVISA